MLASQVATPYLNCYTLSVITLTAIVSINKKKTPQGFLQGGFFMLS